MKRSEFAEIVNAVSREETQRLQEAMKEAASDPNAVAEMLARLAVSIPDVAARTTADILFRAGLISFESDS